ncbi:hypothetical protein I3760_05G089600 [Carya illinoinensis]|nr:hypothetical protein I3760_05G089600 [Carya illinoinensis]
MADQHSKAQEVEASPKVAGESVYCTGIFLEKKEDNKPQEDVTATDAEPMEEEEKPNLLEELRQSESKSGSSSDEDDGGEKKKNKMKGLKEKIKEKISGQREEEDTKHDETFIPADNGNEKANAEATGPEEKKGFIEKIKEKLPGQYKKPEYGASEGCAANEQHSPEGEPKEKKGILEKIKEKLPGCQKNEEKKDE